METIELGRLLFLVSDDYGRVIYEVVKMGEECSCGCSDLLTLEVVADNNTGWEQQYGYHEPDERVETMVKSCLKKLEQELEENKNTFKVIPKDQEEWYKEQIAKENDG